MSLVDAKARPDGRCLTCEKDKKPERSRRYAGHAAEVDPFCSAECARSFYGVTFRGGDDDGWQAKLIRDENEHDVAFDGSLA